MVNRIAKLLTKEVRGLHEAAYLLGIFALLSQVLALIRDRLFASEFGAGELLDLYYAAFKIPDFLFVSIASFISIYVLIPILSDTLESTSEAARKILDTVFTFFFALLIGVSVLVAVSITSLLAFFFPGFTDAQIEVVSVLARILLLQPILLGISNMYASITQLKGRFLLYAVSPLLYNLGIIFGVLCLYPVLGIAGLAWGVVVGAVLHVTVQIPFILSQGLLPRVTFSLSWPTIQRVARLSLPRTLTLSANQLLFMVFMAIASLLSVGSISVLQFAFNLQSVPLAIIGVSYSVAAFPTLAKLFSTGDRIAFTEQITQAMRAIIFWSFPVIVLVVVLRAQIVRVILGSGEFDWADTRLVSAALALFVVSLISQALVMLLVRGFYAAGNTKTPLIANLVSVILSLGVASLFLGVYVENSTFRICVESIFRVEGLVGTTVLMLPLAYSLGVIFNMLVLLVLFQRWYGTLSNRVGSLVIKSSLASCAGGVAAYLLLNVTVLYLDSETFVGIFIQGMISGIAGLLVWLIVLRILKSRELEEVWTAFTHKFWKEKIVVPESAGQ